MPQQPALHKLPPGVKAGSASKRQALPAICFLVVRTERAVENRLRAERDQAERQRALQREAEAKARDFRKGVEARAAIAGRGNPDLVDARSAEGFKALRASQRQGASQKILDVNRQQLRRLDEIAERKPVEFETFAM